MKVTIKGFVHKSPHGETFNFFGCDMSKYGDILVAPHSFEYELPADWNPVAAEVEMIDKKLDEIIGEHLAQVRALNARKATLLCIENNPSEPA